MPCAMSSRSLPCLAVLLVGTALSPTALPSQTAVAQSKPDSAIPTLKSNTQLVVVDVVVTDNDHKPVHGLKLSDFSLTEGNTQQTINHFEEHTALTPAEAAKFPPIPKLPPGIFTNYSPAPSNGASNILLLDALNTPMSDQAFVRQQLLKYLQQVEPGTRIAIFGLTNHLTVLQGFTIDTEILRAVIVKYLAKGSHLLDDTVGGSGTQNSRADNLEDLNIDNPIVAEMIANMRQFEAEQQSFQLQQRAKYTLAAMSQIARYLAVIPGRKNLIWFSGSFPINILPDTTGILRPFAVVGTSEDEFRDTVDLLSGSQVAVYPVDDRGLFNSPIFSATTTRNYTGNPKRMNQDTSKFFTSTTQEHGTMLNMAEATGGRAFVDTNGLAQAVASAIEEGSNFYTLTYSPSNPAHDGEFRKIKVQLAQHGLNLSYRRGYYANDPDKKVVSSDAAVTADGSTQNALHISMMRGAPTPTEIVMKVGVVPINPASQPEDKPAPGNILSATTHGPYRRYSVNYVVEPSDIDFLRTPEGRVYADLEFVIFVFDTNGDLVNAMSNPIHVNGTRDEVEKAVVDGLFYHQEISAPAKGDFFLRIAVQDLNRNHLGAVEVPTAAVQNVVPRTAPSTAPASKYPVSN